MGIQNPSLIMNVVKLMTLCVALLMTVLPGRLGSPLPGEGGDSIGDIFNAFLTGASNLFADEATGAVETIAVAEKATGDSLNSPACVEVMEQDTDYEGSDLFEIGEDGAIVENSNNKKADSAEACRDICKATDGCHAWTYVSSWAVPCLLKENGKGKAEHVGMVSGNVCKFSCPALVSSLGLVVVVCKEPKTQHVCEFERLCPAGWNLTWRYTAGA